MLRSAIRVAALSTLVAVVGCSSTHWPVPRPARPGPVQDVQATSLFGRPLTAPPLPPETLATYDAELAVARERLAAQPDAVESSVWLGRRTAYLGRYQEAIGIYTVGLRAHPDSAELYRHRGHRYLTTRRFRAAEHDLARAAALVAGEEDRVEADGRPNAQNVPTSTLHSNIWYHLGLARYLQGDFAGAVEAYRSGLGPASYSTDMDVAMRYWLHLTLRRLGRDAEASEAIAAIGPETRVIENEAYLELIRLLGGRGDAARGADRREGVKGATTGYGVGAWHLVSGRPAEAHAVFAEVVATTPWAAFGHIAAEAELARMSE